MLGLKLVSLTGFLLATTLLLMPSVARASDLRAMYSSLETRYAHAHTLGDNYQFDPRDGWQSVNVTNLQYKYTRGYDAPGGVDEAQDALEKRTSKKKSSSKAKTTSNASSKSKSKSKSKSNAGSATSKVSKVTSSFQKIVDSIKGVGKAEPVTITWYTGHDLENPSCWSNPGWAPTVYLFIKDTPRLAHASPGCFICMRPDARWMDD